MNKIIHFFNKFHVPWSIESYYCSIVLDVCACCFSNSLEVCNNHLQLLDSWVEKCKFVGKCCLTLFSVVSRHLKNGRNEKRVTGNVEDKDSSSLWMEPSVSLISYTWGTRQLYMITPLQNLPQFPSSWPVRCETLLSN